MIMSDYTDYKLKSGNILRVLPDPNPKSPDKWGNENMFLVYDHQQFSVKREGFEPKAIYIYLLNKENNKKGFEKEYGKEGKDCIFSDYFIFVVYAYVDSGVSLSLRDSEYPFNDRWDTSTTGYILINKELVESTKNLDANKSLDKNPLETRAKEYAEGLIETWNQYLSGDVYGFQILKPIKTYTITEEELMSIFDNNIQAIEYKEFKNIAEENIEYDEIDSCYGFYGSDIKTNGILDHINDEIIE